MTSLAGDAYGQERRILVVDDDTVLRELLVEVLGVEGCVVEEAEDGPTGVEKALAYDYDLILMDNRMPGYRADEATRRVIAQKPRQRIVVVTGSPGDDSVHRALENGALACLAKPFRMEDVTRWLR
jgi:two-component system response regulator (stage 0 sporulation protein F)